MIMMLTTACEMGTFSSLTIVAPTLYSYSDEFQQRAAEELSGLQEKCARDDETPDNCSALRRLLSDYKHNRDQVRVID